MSKPLLIGVTGGIGSGKSTVCNIFQSFDIPIYFADDEAKRLMESNSQLTDSIKQLFGNEAYQDGKLDRSHIASKAFSNPSLLQQLNQVVHPALRIDFENWVKRNHHHQVLIKEAALLIETGSYKELDKLIVVVADESTRIERVLKRDSHRTEEDIKKIITQQISDEERERHADFIVHNSDQDSLIKQVSKIYSDLIVA